MIRAMGNVFDGWARKWMPDPMFFAILLTFLTYILGLTLTKSGPFEMIQYWYNGFWALLAFGMQMCLILVTGHALALLDITCLKARQIVGYTMVVIVTSAIVFILGLLFLPC